MFISKKKYAALANQFEETRKMNAILNDTIDSWIYRCNELEAALQECRGKEKRDEEPV